MNPFDFAGRTAVVTGGMQGIGAAIAQRLQASGAKVAIWDLDGKPRVDVADQASIDAAVKRTIAELGKIDVLINNAGAGEDSFGKPIEEISDDEWRRGIDNNLSSQFYCARAALPHMVKQKRGKVINVASGYGLRGGKHNYMYACSKGAVLQLTRSLALTYAEHNIQTNCIVPGIFPHNERLMRFFKGGKFIPIGRVGHDEDVGPLAVFLASEASNHVNGELIVIDGGGLAGGITPTGVAPGLPV
jgi:NAD(P)-dependent dehydrogenase (short-subunit alcohol dehydrogenase family)